MHIDLSLDQTSLSAARRAARHRPWMPLVTSLLALAEGEGELIRHAERAWASVTFTGTRHTVLLGFTGAAAVAAAERFIDALPDHEFTLPRQLVADAAVIAATHTALPEPRLDVEVELLLLDEC